MTIPLYLSGFPHIECKELITNFSKEHLYILNENRTTKTGFCKMKRKVLIVEDHDVLRKAMTKWLSDTYPELEFIKAETGEEALELSEKMSFEIAIVDILLPGIDGFEVTSKLVEKSSKTEVIILTMYDGEEYKERAFTKGARFFINKKDLYAMVPKAINEILNHSPGG